MNPGAKPLIHLLCGGGLMAVSAGVDGELVELPADLADRLRERMTYVHLHFLHGRDAFLDDGTYMPTQPQRRELFRMDDDGRLLCGLGFLHFARTQAELLGYAVEVEKVRGWAEHPRPDRFRVDWSAVDSAKARYRQLEMLGLIAREERGVFKAVTGAGKTWAITQVPRLLPEARIKIVVDGLSILDSIYARLRGQGLTNVGQVGGGKKKFNRVTVVSADSMRLCDFDDRVGFGGTDVWLLDEVHRLMAESYQEPLSRIAYAKVFGFSATPDGRADGGAAKVEAVAGPVVYELTYPEAVAHGLVSPIMVEWLRYPKLGESPAAKMKTKPARYRAGIWFNDERNDLLADRIRALPDNVQTLVLVQTLDHAMELKKRLPEFWLCYDMNSMRKKGSTDRYDAYVRQGLIDPVREPLLSPKLRREMRERFERRELLKVIATDVWSTGVDFVSLEVLVRADARAGLEVDNQGPGRASRRYEGKEYGLVIDVMDEFDDYFLRQAKARRRNYNRNQWTSTFERQVSGLRS